MVIDAKKVIRASSYIFHQLFSKSCVNSEQLPVRSFTSGHCLGYCVLDMVFKILSTASE